MKNFINPTSNRLLFFLTLGVSTLLVLPQAQALDIVEKNTFTVNGETALKMWIQTHFDRSRLFITATNEKGKAYAKLVNDKKPWVRLAAHENLKVSAALNKYNKLERLLYFLASRGLVQSVKITNKKNMGVNPSLMDSVILGMESGSIIESFTLKDSRLITRDLLEKEDVVYLSDENRVHKDVCVKMSFVEELIKANRSEYAELLQGKAKDGMVCESELPLAKITPAPQSNSTAPVESETSHD